MKRILAAKRVAPVNTCIGTNVVIFVSVSSFPAMGPAARTANAANAAQVPFLIKSKTIISQW